ELFSKGELSIDRFVDDDGKTLTLKQLREREPMALTKSEK
ncbi:MAG: phage head morphogenesis protein, partial [Pseudomonas alloputida]